MKWLILGLARTAPEGYNACFYVNNPEHLKGQYCIIYQNIP